VGGPARDYIEIFEPQALAELLPGVKEQPLHILGGGSNLLVADEGFDGLVVRIRSAHFRREGDRLDLGAGLSWDQAVQAAIAEGLAGLECLSGIPGDVGAAPVQNIGAYGQELGDSLESVEVMDRQGRRQRLSAEACRLSYRSSLFREQPGRFVILSIRLRLSTRSLVQPQHPGLRARVEGAISLERLREEVLKLRRAKSMLLDPEDPNYRSAGSFFLNPIISQRHFEGLQKRLKTQGFGPEELPFWPLPSGVKLSAAWLIQQAGFPPGFAQGRVGLSSRHSLALINRGGASAQEIVCFAAFIRRRVQARFGLSLSPEPIFLGFKAPVQHLLDEA